MMQHLSSPVGAGLKEFYSAWILVLQKDIQFANCCHASFILTSRVEAK